MRGLAVPDAIEDPSPYPLPEYRERAVHSSASDRRAGPADGLLPGTPGRRWPPGRMGLEPSDRDRGPLTLPSPRVPGEGRRRLRVAFLGKEIPRVVPQATVGLVRDTRRIDRPNPVRPQPAITAANGTEVPL